MSEETTMREIAGFRWSKDGIGHECERCRTVYRPGLAPGIVEGVGGEPLCVRSPCEDCLAYGGRSLHDGCLYCGPNAVGRTFIRRDTDSYYAPRIEVLRWQDDGYGYSRNDGTPDMWDTATRFHEWHRPATKAELEQRSAPLVDGVRAQCMPAFPGWTCERNASDSAYVYRASIDGHEYAMTVLDRDIEREGSIGAVATEAMAFVRSMAQDEVRDARRASKSERIALVNKMLSYKRIVVGYDPGFTPPAEPVTLSLPSYQLYTPPGEWDVRTDSEQPGSCISHVPSHTPRKVYVQTDEDGDI